MVWIQCGKSQERSPRSVLTVTLNDKDTGEPLAFMSANLLSAARTGAVPGVAARHLARKDSEVVAVLGCGQINRSCPAQYPVSAAKGKDDRVLRYF